MAGFFPSDSEARASWAPWLTGAISLAYYLACASGAGGFGEEGAFIAAARELEVTYPPGAPVSVLLSAPFALLPLGPLSFRAAVASAVCGAITLALFARALLCTLPHMGVKSAPLSGGLALAASLWLGQTPLFAQQVLRPQLFAAQLLLSMLVFGTLLRFEAEQPTDSMRTLYIGAFVQGLCFANHHVYALLLLPVAAPTLGRVFAYRGFMGLMGYVAAPLLGFSAYVYVPSRLASGALKEQSGLARLALMLGEEPYWGPSWAPPLPVLKTLQEGLCRDAAGLVILLLLAALGFASMLRSSNRRRFGLVWFIALLVPLASVWLMLEPKLREDAWGALAPCAFALVAAAAVGAGQLLEQIDLRAPRAAHVLAPVLPLLALLMFARGAPANDAQAALGDAFEELARRSLPASSALYLHDASSAFRYLGAEAEEGQLRADVSAVPLALRELPHLFDRRAHARPELAASLTEVARDARLSARTLRALSTRAPVYLELSEQLPASVYESSAEDGLWLRALTPDAVASAASSEKAAQRARLRQLYRGAGDLSRLPHGAVLRLGHTHLLQALRRASLGDRQGAREYLDLCRALGFDDARVARLDGDLASEVPVAIEDYLRLQQ